MSLFWEAYVIGWSLASGEKLLQDFDKANEPFGKFSL